MIEFETFQKIPRLSRKCVVTEKIDGTNGQILITEDGKLYAGSRNRWVLDPTGILGDDNFGFGRWVLAHQDELIAGLGIGRHFGEWWGQGIARKYGLQEKRFSLFNVSIWGDDAVRPKCCHVVPVLWEGIFDTIIIEDCVNKLRRQGSVAAPGFMNPEGIIVFHTASSALFKKTCQNDESPKGKVTEE